MRKKVGRPKMKLSAKAKIVAISLPPDRIKWLDAECKRQKQGRSAVVEAMLAQAMQKEIPAIS